MLLFYTAFLVFLVASPHAADCQCFGALKVAQDARINNRLALGRNLFLLSILSTRFFSVRNPGATAPR